MSPAATRLLAVARKEVIQLRRDPRSLGLAFLLPLLLLVLFAYAITTDVTDIRAAVVDHSRSPESRALVAAFARSGYFSVTETPATDRDANTLVERGAVRVALVIPERYAPDLAAHRGAPVELLLDGSDAKTATTARGYADAIVRSHSARLSVSGRPALRAESRVWYNETLDSKTMIVPGLIGVIMSIIAAMLTSLTVAREWERGTMEQLAATPVGRGEVILGKLLPYLVIGLVDVLVALAVGVYGFGVPFRGSVPLFLLASTIFLLGVLGLGIMLSCKLRTQLLATQAAIFATYMPALLLSGFMFTIDNMPAPLRLASRVVAARYFVELTRGIFLKASGVDVLWPSLVGLALYAAATIALSVRSFRKELA
ncbi:export ABC transporter permease (plasmid) [Gemmatirosa kalamazoonensis]|uniref:Export ABC transporter permease n=1 Tax=Gemmatirosa kalamazoonensis TaxID=861299 RepID=W0RTU6_9BACT|nr:ABC transporter permease [Gemmatirosa kalamazoonensis]AHG93018.1 export ABC transporter permease [Gemmatirosa kalamazoonensis]